MIVAAYRCQRVPSVSSLMRGDAFELERVGLCSMVCGADTGTDRARFRA